MKPRLASALFLCALSLTATAAEVSVALHSGANPQAALVLQAPDAWRSRVLQPGAGLPTLVEFTPTSGAAFKVVLTVMQARGDTPPPSREAIASGTARAAAKAAERSVEPAPLPIKELKGAAMFGSYFEATDRQPEPRGFKHLTQGTAVIGTTALAFTVLANDEAGSNAAEVERDALQMLTSARRSP